MDFRSAVTMDISSEHIASFQVPNAAAESPKQNKIYFWRILIARIFTFRNSTPGRK